MSSTQCKMIFSIFLIVNLVASEKCPPSDVMYKYTECDANGHRWRVSIQTNSTKQCELPAPIEARNCKKPCEPGTYLLMKTETCENCDPGTYSQSSTIEIDNWREISREFSSYSSSYDENDCESEKWQAKGDYIGASISKCESRLYYTASLFDAGDIIFEYQHPDENIIFSIKISNENCQSSSKTEKNSNFVKYLDPTGPSSWKKIRFSLKTGQNTIRWMVVGIESHRITVKIRFLQITNSIFISQCMKCKAGFYSIIKSSRCMPCPMNKFSKERGSAQCSDCPKEKFSFPGSESCMDKPACERADYSYQYTECNKQNQRKKTFFWIKPKLCSDTIPNSVKLPNESKLETCMTCPKGTYLNETTNSCEFCPVGTVSEKPGDKCTTCGPNTKLVTEIDYDRWTHPLPNLTFRCLSIDQKVKDCNINETWIYNGDSLQTSPVFDMNLLQLDFEIIKIRNSTEKSSESQFSFTFKTTCSSYCILHLFLKKSKKSTMLINSWTNSSERKTFNYNIPQGNTGRFIWFFSRSRDYRSYRKTNDYLNIYSIKMSKVKNAGAVRCQFCNPKVPSNECTDCGKGKYFSFETHNCTHCLPGYVIETNPTDNNNKCVKCEEGLIAVDGYLCLPNMHYKTKNQNHYDLSKLKGSHTVLGKNLFTVHGIPYQHLFNITFFSDTGSLSLCKNNLTNLNDFDLYESGPICRLILITDKQHNGTVYTTQSIRLADKFIKMLQSNSSTNYWKQMNNSLTTNGFLNDSNGMDLHLHMKSERQTDNCKNGYGTILTLRCDVLSTKNELILPPNCAVGTCDGCNFHFLLVSRHVCSECRPQDYKVSTFECINGHQERIFQAPNYCIPPAGFRDKVDIKCPLFTMRMEISIIITSAVLCFLVGLVIYCHKKNKKLEYKYSRLISGNDDNENVLNGAESCGMNDDEEDDEDDVKIKTNSKSGKIFAKYNKPFQYRKDNSMERINLNENPDFDI